jgi:hypothetical protein
LKTAIDEGSRYWGIGRLKSGNAQFQILDFTKFVDPKTVLAEAMSQIPRISEVDPTIAGESFSDFYPGKIMAIIGVENIPPEINAIDLNIIAKRAPTVFIKKEGVRFEKMSPGVRGAIGAFSDGSYKAKK